MFHPHGVLFLQRVFRQLHFPPPSRRHYQGVHHRGHYLQRIEILTYLSSLPIVMDRQQLPGMSMWTSLNLRPLAFQWYPQVDLPTRLPFCCPHHVRPGHQNQRQGRKFAQHLLQWIELYRKNLYRLIQCNYRQHHWR